MIKAWTKISIRAEVSGDTSWYTWLSRREPSSLAGTHLKRSETPGPWRSSTIQSALETDMDVSSYYHRAADALMNFVWDYRQHISVDDPDLDSRIRQQHHPTHVQGAGPIDGRSGFPVRAAHLTEPRSRGRDGRRYQKLPQPAQNKKGDRHGQILEF